MGIRGKDESVSWQPLPLLSTKKLSAAVVSVMAVGVVAATPAEAYSGHRYCHSDHAYNTGCQINGNILENEGQNLDYGKACINTYLPGHKGTIDGTHCAGSGDLVRSSPFYDGANAQVWQASQYVSDLLWGWRWGS